MMHLACAFDEFGICMRTCDALRCYFRVRLHRHVFVPSFGVKHRGLIVPVPCSNSGDAREITNTSHKMRVLSVIENS